MPLALAHRSTLSGVLGIVETVANLNVSLTLVFVAAIMALPLTWYTHVDPCWSCRDFRAVAMHEVLP